MGHAAVRFRKRHMASLSPSDSRRYLGMAGLLLACLGVGWLGLLTGGSAGDLSVALWPSSGLALAAMLGFGRSVWPAVFLGAAIPLFVTSSSVVWATIVAAGLTVEAGLASLLVERFARGTQAFERPDSILRVALIAGLAGAVTGLAVSLAT